MITPGRHFRVAPALFKESRHFRVAPELFGARLSEPRVSEPRDLAATPNLLILGTAWRRQLAAPR